MVLELQTVQTLQLAESVLYLRARHLPQMRTAAPCTAAVRPPGRPNDRPSDLGIRGGVAVVRILGGVVVRIIRGGGGARARPPALRTKRAAITPERRGIGKGRVSPVVHSLAQFCTLTNSVGRRDRNGAEEGGAAVI